MDSFELNKILGAILGTLLFVMGVGFVAEAVYHPIEGRGPGYELPEPAGGEGATAEAQQPAQIADIGTLLASANVDDGKASAAKCQGCHNFDPAKGNSTGPNLYGVVGRPIAGHEGFNYSDAMKQHAAEAGDWTYANLNIFLHAPKEAVPGTKMAFAGVKDDQERANIIAFLSTLSDNPVPFPAPAAAGGEQPAAATEGTAPVATGAQTATPSDASTPVEGAATGSNTPAGAETPAAGGTVPSPAEAPAAPAATAPAVTTTTAPAETPPPAATTTTTAPATTTTTTTAPAAAPAMAPANPQTSTPAAPMAAPAENTMAPAVPTTTTTTTTTTAPATTTTTTTTAQ